MSGAILTGNITKVKLYFPGGQVIKTNTIHSCEINMTTEYFEHSSFGRPNMNVPLNSTTDLNLKLGQLQFIEDGKVTVLTEEDFQKLKRKLDV